MRKLLNFVWLLAIALSATTVFTSCSKNEDDPNRSEEREKGTVEVNPAKVFINGMPKAIDGYILTCDSKGRLSSLYNKEEKETVTFEYKTNVLGSTDEPNVVMTMREENDKTVYNLFLNKDGFVKYCDEIEYEKNKTYKKATWNFEYNSDGQLAKAIQSKDGFKRGCVKIDTSSFLLSLYLIYHIIRYLLQLCC